VVQTALWNKGGLKTTAVLSTQLAIYQSTLTITVTNISYYTGYFNCILTNAKGGIFSEVGPYEGILY